MSVMQFTVSLSAGAVQDIEKNVLIEYVSYIDKIFANSIPVIKAKVPQIISKLLRASDSWAAINGGDLQKILYIPSPTTSLFQIEKAIIDSIDIIKTPVSVRGQNIAGSFTVSVLDDSYAQVLSAGETSYVTKNGKLIPWVEWLIYFGDSPVLSKMRLLETNRGTYVVKSNDDLFIPSAYSGIPVDNFLTRALEPAEQEIGNLIEIEVSRRA